MRNATQMKRKENSSAGEAASGSFLHQSMATEKTQKIANSAPDWWERGGKDGRKGQRLQLHVYCSLVFHATPLCTLENIFWEASSLRQRLVQIGAE